MEILVNKFCRSKDTISDPANFMILWIKSGDGSITIDFEEFTAAANSIWFILPGKRVSCEFKSPPSGWVLSFTKSFFNNTIRENLIIRDVQLFQAFGTIPKIILSPKIGSRVHSIAEMIDELSGSQIPNKEAAIAALLKTLLVYCDSRCNIRVITDNNVGKIQIVTRFKDLVEQHVLEKHKVSDYATMMNISPKYLNQVVKEVLDTTPKALITEQLIILARRELKFSSHSVKEIAFRLGFSEPFHFSSYFKKQTGSSPSEFRMQ